jgi:hypothetical protein
MIIKFLQDTLKLSKSQRGLTYYDLKDHKYFTLYAISCFFYAISGLIRIYQGSRQDGINLIIQSLLSYISDVYKLGEPSYWNIIDRYYAVSISIYHFYYLKTPEALSVNLILFLIGFNFLAKSRQYYATHSDKYLLEHTKWHSVAPIMAILSDI